MKKILGIIVALALMLTVVGQAQAAGNNTTGANSTNRVIVRNKKIVKTANLQGSLVLNGVMTNQSSGGNVANNNTKMTGGITSGLTSSGTSLGTSTNYAETQVKSVTPAAVVGGNSITGNNSTNVTRAESTNVVKTANVQIGIVGNFVMTNQNSGGNVANGNTVMGGGITSGGIVSNTTIVNDVNTAATMVVVK